MTRKNLILLLFSLLTLNSCNKHEGPELRFCENYIQNYCQGDFMGVKTKCTKEEQRQKDRYPVYIRRLAARHPRTHRETKCYFGDTFVLHLNQI